jgi:hypothetical protein
LVIRAAKSQSSIRVICISSSIDSTRIIFSIKFDRNNRGLLTEASAQEEAAASLANGTKRRSAKELRLRHRADAGAKWPKEGRKGLAGVMEESIADARELSECAEPGLVLPENSSPNVTFPLRG